MGIFSGLFKSRDKAQGRTMGSNYAFFMGSTTSGKAVTERSAMQMTAVYSCVRILSEAVAGLPLHLYKYTDSGGKAMALDHPLYHLLHDEPNPEMSSFVFRETLMRKSSEMAKAKWWRCTHLCPTAWRSTGTRTASSTTSIPPNPTMRRP